MFRSKILALIGIRCAPEALRKRWMKDYVDPVVRMKWALTSETSARHHFECQAKLIKIAVRLGLDKKYQKEMRGNFEKRWSGDFVDEGVTALFLSSQNLDA